MKSHSSNASGFSPIAVLGAGAWGTALAMLLARNGQQVRLWDLNTDHLLRMQNERAYAGVAFPESLHIVTQLAEAVFGVEDICLVVPSHAFRSLLTQLKSLVVPNVRFVWGTKGLDPVRCDFLHTVIAEVFSPETPAAVLSGPSFAREVVQNLPTAVSLAGNNPDFLETIARRFHNHYFRVYQNPDLIGVQLCGVVKNVMAIAVGISDGMGFGANTRCALMTRGIAELSKLCEAMGGRRDTLMSLAGIGDLVLTSMDNQSRNRRFGLEIGQGSSAEAALKKIGESVEGYYNAKQLFQLAARYKVEIPVCSQVYEILYENRSPNSVVSGLLDRAVMME